MPEALEQDIPLQQLKQVTKSLNSGQFVQVRRMLAKTAPCDTALLLESSPHKIRRMLWHSNRLVTLAGTPPNEEFSLMGRVPR